VEALLAPHHRLAADGYDSARSHLSKRKDAWGEEGNAKARGRKDAGKKKKKKKRKMEGGRREREGAREE